MTYTITYVDAKGGGELSTFVEADEVSFDAHWVSFRRQEPPTKHSDTDACDNCGRLTTRPRVSAGSRRTVALFPAPRVRAVVESEKVT